MEVVRPVGAAGRPGARCAGRSCSTASLSRRPSAAGPELALQPIIDQGGVGDYNDRARGGARRRVGADQQRAERAARAAPDGDAWRPGIAPTVTPALVAVDTPGVIPPPAVPTRRPTPARAATWRGSRRRRWSPRRRRPPRSADRRRGPTGPASSGPTSTPWHPGECTNLHWKVENVITRDCSTGRAATGNETRQVCPTQTTTLHAAGHQQRGHPGPRRSRSRSATSAQPAIVVHRRQDAGVAGRLHDAALERDRRPAKCG